MYGENRKPLSIVTLKKLAKAYTTLAVLIVNTLLICACINLALIGYAQINEDVLITPTRIPDTQQLTVPSFGALTYGLDVLRQVYPGRTDEDIIRLVLESSSVPYQCDDNLGFRLGEFQGFYVNVDPVGFRWNAERPPWPPDEAAFNVFVFGGSTAFGYGESNDKTISAYLQQYLRTAAPTDNIVVYNFGQMAYFSLQEKWLLRELVNDGADVDLAVFIDGLNEFFYWDGKPWESEGCHQPNTPDRQFVNLLRCDYGEFCIPIQRIHFERAAKEESESPSYPPEDDATTNRNIINRWLANKADAETFASELGIDLVFVIQPVPMHAYDLTYNVITHDMYPFAAARRAHWAYPIWEEMLADPAAAWTDNTLYLGRIAEDKQEPLYLDRFHYTAAFMDELAGYIADFIVSKNLIPQASAQTPP